jgi:hypothetical protein
MPRLQFVFAALAGMLCCAGGAQAQTYIKAPFVRIQTGGPDGPVYVKVPLVTVDVPAKYPGYYLVPVYTAPAVPAPPPPDPVYVVPPQPPTVVVPPPVVTPPPLVVPPPPVVVPKNAVLNHYQFAKTFVPTPGPHVVTIIHPGTNAPVEVSFTLPPGTPRVEALPRAVVFSYGITEIEIFFGLKGKVKVIQR